MGKLIDLNNYIEAEPDIEAMNRDELCAYLETLKAKLSKLDEHEPKNMNSEKYDEWADVHEELEDLVDEVLERLDELQ